MFLLSKLFNFIFLPPGIFVVLGIAAIILYLVKKNRAAVALFCAVPAFMYALSIAPVQNSLLLPLEDKYAPIELKQNFGKKPEYIVVLGGGTIGGGTRGKETISEEAENTELSNTSYKRLGHAFVLHRQTGLPLILTGGRVYPGQDREPEAALAEKVLIEFGVDPSFILTETQSRNTWENAQNVKEIAGNDAVILVTSAFHMPRGVLSFEAAEIETVPAPADFRTARSPSAFTDYLPSMARFHNCYTALHEHIGLLYYRLKKLL